MIDRRRKTKDRYDLLIDGLFRIYEKALRIRFHWQVECSRSEDRAPQEKYPTHYGNAPRESSSPIIRVKNAGSSPCAPRLLFIRQPTFLGAVANDVMGDERTSQGVDGHYYCSARLKFSFEIDVDCVHDHIRRTDRSTCQP